MIREFTLGAAHTINLGNYSSMRVEASITVTVPEGDDFEALKEKAQSELRRMLEETYRAQRREHQ